MNDNYFFNVAMVPQGQTALKHVEQFTALRNKAVADK